MPFPSHFLCLSLLAAAPLGLCADAAGAAVFDADDTTITVGSGFACALHDVAQTTASSGFVVDDSAYSAMCWGTGPAVTSEIRSALQQKRYTQLSAADGHACGVTASGDLECFGNRHVPRSLHAPGARFVAVAAGASHVCALLGNGTAVCAGRNNMGQTSPPVDAAFAQISCSKDSCCGIRRGEVQDLLCWGSPYAGVTHPPAGSFSQLSLGGDGHACAISSAPSGDLVCWGSGAGPQGGNYTIPGPFLQVSAAAGITCAIRADSTLACFGDGHHRLWSDASAPPQATRFVEVAAYGDDVCGITTDIPPRVLCFGPSGKQLIPPAELLLPA